VASDVIAQVARWRVPLGFAAGAVVWWLSQPTPQSLASGAIVAAIGETLRVWAAGHLNKGREVTSSGPYRWLAHPLYVGSSVMAIGLALASRSIAVAVVAGLYVGVTFTAAVKTEERALREAFGDAYDRYRREPSVDGTRRFSWHRALANGEHRTIAGLVLTLAALAVRSRL
jgi:protein-S-isoprenylcysteine O-methyltransferase Ste14